MKVVYRSMLNPFLDLSHNLTRLHLQCIETASMPLIILFLSFGLHHGCLSIIRAEEPSIFYQAFGSSDVQTKARGCSCFSPWLDSCSASVLCINIWRTLPKQKKSSL